MTHEKFQAIFDEMVSACEEIDNTYPSVNKVQTKSVLASVLTSYHSANYIAPFLGISRTAVCYHSRQHPKNIAYWVGYEDKYVKCKQIYSKHSSCDVCKDKHSITIIRANDSCDITTDTINCPICTTDFKYEQKK